MMLGYKLFVVARVKIKELPLLIVPNEGEEIMKQELITSIEQSMLLYLNNDQLLKLRETLKHALFDVEVKTKNY